MNEKLPYEEIFHQQLKDILLPDENMAWVDMKHRLQEEDDDPAIAWWRKGCILWGIIFTALLGVGLYWYYSGNKPKQNLKQNEIQENIPTLRKGDTVSKYIGQDKLNSKKPDSTLPFSDSITNTSNNYLLGKEKKYTRKSQKLLLKKYEGNSSNSKKQIRRYIKNNSVTTHPIKKKKEHIKDAFISGKENYISYERDSVRNMTGKVQILSDTISGKVDTLHIYHDTAFIISNEVKLPGDRIKDSAFKKTITEDSSKKDPSKQNKISFSTGLMLYQQVPINGQTLTPYNSLGRKGTWRDYIPSLYVRINKSDKWFIQSGCMFGAPQNNKAMVFDKKIDSVPFSSKIQTASTSIKKTYYHQVPLTFNYFITPNWSLGAGIVWNKFYSAVTEQNTIQHDFISGADSIITQNFISSRTKADSNFSKSFFQGVIETAYKWKRFSFGMSYAQGLQPYIKFKLPGEAEKKEKNSSLKIFIRYEFWNSKKK